MKKAQSILEYAVVISVVAAALMAMHVYVQRAVQGNLKMIEEKVEAYPKAK
jgi:Flp pilus assembly pilin Flp